MQSTAIWRPNDGPERESKSLIEIDFDLAVFEEDKNIRNLAYAISTQRVCSMLDPQDSVFEVHSSFAKSKQGVAKESFPCSVFRLCMPGALPVGEYSGVEERRLLARLSLEEWSAIEASFILRPVMWHDLGDQRWFLSVTACGSLFDMATAGRLLNLTPIWRAGRRR